MTESGSAALSARDWHVLMALAGKDRHGYAIMKAVEQDSDGRVTAPIGSLYRVLDRLLDAALVMETDPPKGAPSDTRGRPRRYYALTDQGREALGREAVRLRDAVQLAQRRAILEQPTQ